MWRNSVEIENYGPNHFPGLQTGALPAGEVPDRFSPFLGSYSFLFISNKPFIVLVIVYTLLLLFFDFGFLVLPFVLIHFLFFPFELYVIIILLPT